jgi:hypothetical protein
VFSWCRVSGRAQRGNLKAQALQAANERAGFVDLWPHEVVESSPFCDNRTNFRILVHRARQHQVGIVALTIDRFARDDDWDQYGKSMEPPTEQALAKLRECCAGVPGVPFIMVHVPRDDARGAGPAKRRRHGRIEGAGHRRRPAVDGQRRVVR